MQGHRLPQLQELQPYQSLFFGHLVAGDQKASLPGPSLLLPSIQALKGPLGLGPTVLFHMSGT